MATVHFTKDTFRSDVLEAKGTALVDFWADWCNPCKMLGPIIDDVANELNGSVLVGKVNVDEMQDMAVKYGVMNIPTVIFFKDGTEISRLTGIQPKQKLIDMTKNV